MLDLSQGFLDVKARSFVGSALDYLENLLPLRFAAGDRLILAYHNVVPASAVPVGEKSLHMPLEMFAEQLQILKRYYRVVPLMELLENEVSDGPMISVTFDDAYASSLELGVSECRRQRVPCTVFVAPALLGQVPYWDAMAERGEWTPEVRRRFLSEEKGVPSEITLPLPQHEKLLRIATESELAAAVAEGSLTLGSHSFRHINLRAHSLETVRRELCDSHAWILTRFQAATLPVVAYPYGYPPNDSELCLGNLLKFGLLADGGWMFVDSTHRRSLIPRWNVTPMSPARFTVHLGGWFRRMSRSSRYDQP